MRVDITAPPTTMPLSLAISPDGRTIAFVATSEGQSRLWLRSLASGSARAVRGTDGAASPFWSPDSRSVGFFAEGKLRRVDVDGGSVQTLANTQGGTDSSGAWNRDDVILFVSVGTPIYRISAKGGEPVALSGLVQQGSDFSPQFLPDGRHFLYYVRGSPEVRGVYVGQLDETVETRRLLDSDTGAVYASSGQLLFVRQGTLFAQDFDPVRLALKAAPFPVAEGSRFGPGSRHCPSPPQVPSSIAPVRRLDNISSGSGSIGPARRLGKRAMPLLPPATSLRCHQMAAVWRCSVLANGNPDIWLLETGRGRFSRFTV